MTPWAVTLVATLAALLGFRFAVRRGLAPKRVPHDRTPADLGLTFDAVRIPTARGRRLYAWFVPAESAVPAPVALVMHGWGGNAAMMLPLVPALHAAGLTVLLVDARCHGHSDEDDFASLPRFAEDIDHALAWLRHYPYADAHRIALVGHSVGAGAALLAASRRDDVAAVVSLAAFSHPVAMMRRLLAHKRVPYLPLGWLVLRYVEHVIGHRFDDIAPVTTIAAIRCPTLLVHGAQDTTVPPSEARLIHAARSGEHVRLRIIAASHDDFGDPQDIAAEVAEMTGFLRKALTEPA
ncbi:alpha/beta fold hydrolase [Thauera aromatica]|uniref:alpha/beta hydrolase n=1 Tax=Thauera aromatica TaxID=59405 RepID=UPI001FFCF98E|nr:alpha/beta fold hydrolase [Thauera aromatica]MCK2087459.1 alpha/beta fold hydrolase [Thauera aromatica]